MSWPALRTRAGLRLSWPRLALAGAIAWAAPVPLGALLIGLGALLRQAPEAPLQVTGFFLVASAYLSWAGLLVGVPLSVLALRRGWAGWAVALGTGAALGAAAGLATGLEAGIVLPGALVIAAVYWLALRRMTGPALAP
jgi:hypothetical protein